MKKLLITLFLILPGTFLFSQKYIDVKVWNRWDSLTIAKANTAINADFMTSEEKLVILITNLARFDGPLFSETFLNSYLEGEEKNKYNKSLYKDLKSVKGLQALYPEKDLYEIAEGHAIKSGKNGRVGHQGFEARFKPLMKNIIQLPKTVLMAMIWLWILPWQLLIDKDVPTSDTE